MKILDNVANKFGYSKKRPATRRAPAKSARTAKSGSYDKIWLRALESQLESASITEPYKQHQTVFMAIDAIADTAPSVDFKLYRGEDGPEVKKHKIADLLRRPNPLMCRFQLWEATIVYLKMRGACFWVFGESLGQQAGTSKAPAEIWPFSPDNFRPIYDKSKNELQGWRYGELTFGVDEVVYFHKFDPFDHIRGNNITEKIRKTIDLDYKSLLYNWSFFHNAGVPEGVLTTEKSLSDQQFQRLLKQFEDRHKGVNKARRVALLEAGLKYEASAETHRDMEFLEQRRYNREEILGIWRVPKSLFSITDDLNYATAREQKRIFWENSIIPTLTYVEEVLNAFFFPKYSPELYGQFDLSRVVALMSDFTEKVDNAVKLYGIGFTANEINKRLDLGFDDKPWRSTWWIPFGQVPADQVMNDPFALPGPEGEPPAADPDPEDEPKLNDNAIEKLARFVGPDYEAVKQNELISWERFDRLSAPIEREYARRLKAYFFHVRKAVLAEIEKNAKSLGDLSNVNWDSLEALLIKTSRPFLLQATERGVKNAADFMNANINFEIFNPKIISFAKDKEVKIKRVNDTVKREVMNIVQESIRTGASVQDASKEVRRMFNFAADRSIRIARTEVIGATNGGQLLYYKESGIKRKKWITARDEKVRESHKRLHGQVMDIEKNFSNGLDHPGGNGPAEEVINCRCTVTPVIS